MAIARIQTQDREINQLQDNLLGQLNPVLRNPLLQGVIVQRQLSVGANVIPHGLGRTLQGWFVVRQRAASQIYDQQDTNQTPDKTLLLNASAAVLVDLFIF